MLKSLVDITEKDLQEVTNLAELYFTPKEVAIMLELNAEEAVDSVKEGEGPFYQAFQRGRLQSEMELRRSIVKLAKSGSSPAQTMALELLNKSKIKLLDR